MAKSDLIGGNIWEKYSKKVIQRMNAPGFLGEFSEEDAAKRNAKLVVADFGSEACGDAVRLYWLVDPNTDRIIDARFKSFGCGTAIASSDMMAELTIGKTVDEATKITNLDVEKALRDDPDTPAFPAQKMHCSVMAYDVIVEAAAKYKQINPNKIKNSEIVCECARVTRGEIEEIIRKHKVKTVEELQKYTDAGTYCKSCVKPGGHEERPIYLVDIIEEVNKKMEEEKRLKPQHFEDMSLFNKIKAIENVLQNDVSSVLAMDGGSVKLVDVKENDDKSVEVLVEYAGTCSTCNAAFLTLHMIEETLKDALKTDKIKVIQV